MEKQSKLSVVLLVLLLSAGFSWIVATDRQRQDFLQWLGLLSPPPPQPTRNYSVPRIADTPRFDQPMRQICKHPTPSACRSDVVPNPTKKSPAKIYRWVDENGRTQFSDKQPDNGEAERLDPKAYQDTTLFSLDLDFDGLAGITGFQDKVDAEVQAIYSFLESHLTNSELQPVHVAVTVVNGKNRFLRLREKLAPKTDTTSGFYTFRHNRAVVRFRKDTENTLAVVRHEVTHLLIGNLFGDLDIWLNEGLAEFFERMEIHGQAAEIDATERETRNLRKALRAGRLPSLNRLMAMNYDDWHGKDEQFHYAQSWTLIHYLMSQDDERVLLGELLSELRNQRCKPFSTRDFFHDRYPGGLASLERKWRKWLLSVGDKRLYF